MQYSTNEHCLSIRSREQFLVLFKLCKKDCTDFDNEANKLRVLGKLINLGMLPDIVLDSMVYRLHKWLFRSSPTVRYKALFCPDFHESVEGRVAKVVVHDSNDTAPTEKRINITQCFIQVNSPVCHRMKLHMLSCNGIVPKKDQGLLGIEIDIIKFGLHKSLRVQIDVDSKQICYLVFAIIVHIREICKEETCNVSESTIWLGTGIIMDGLGLLQNNCCAHCLIVAWLWCDDSFFAEKLSDPQNDCTLFP
mmetsp:Transcript_31655/g.76606  ORF Transcript_31655/g.76606 Transcript_31655/m.76606 type:complete len:250 (-) Transcript_31655:536-1285(-)